MHYSAGCHRSLPVAIGAFPSPGLAFKTPSLAVATMRTSKTLWPAHRRKVLGASCFIAKSLLEFVQRAGEIVHSRLRINRRYPTWPTRCVCLWTKRRAPSLPRQTARLFGGLGSQSSNKRCNTTCDLRRKIRASDNGLKKGMNRLRQALPPRRARTVPGVATLSKTSSRSALIWNLAGAYAYVLGGPSAKLDRSAAMPSSDVTICRRSGSAHQLAMRLALSPASSIIRGMLFWHWFAKAQTRPSLFFRQPCREHRQRGWRWLIGLSGAGQMLN